MTATSRTATSQDIPLLVGLYRELEKEMVALSDLWPLTSGLAEPVEDSWADALSHPETITVIGSYEGYPFGFVMARIESLLPQAEGLRIGAIRLVFVEREAREAGVGEVMRDHILGALRERGISRFDAHVLPGHRLAKNFFEQGGFSARHIVMHHDDADD